MVELLSTEVTQKMQKIELNMLNEFIKICRKNNLRYFLVGGSCLGAVRHKGFIPWDDDIDVAMPRNDYEKFLSLAQRYLPSHLFLQYAKSDKNYPQTFAKIRNCSTAYIEYSTHKITMNHGVFIDIFPLDGYKKSVWFDLRKKVLECMMRNAFSYEDADRGWKKVVFWTLKQFKIDYRNVRDLLDKLFKSRSFEECNMVAVYAGAWGNRERYKKSCFIDTIYGVFEGVTVSLPFDTNEYLSTLYGDYLILPPKEKRVSHHKCIVVDLDNSYLNYVQ